MYARIVDCTVRPDRAPEFKIILRDQVLPLLKDLPGFINLLALVSDEHPAHGLALTLWNSRENAEQFYQHQAPVQEFLQPILTGPPTVEHFNLDAAMFKVAFTGKAAA